VTPLNQTPDGVLLVDKAEGMTSHDVVALVRRKLDIKKIGHCGTLDPIATGLLLLTIGRGTKIQDLLMRVLLIDRENQQALLRRGLVPPKHLSLAAGPQPSHYVASVYRRNAAT